MTLDPAPYLAHSRRQHRLVSTNALTEMDPFLASDESFQSGKPRLGSSTVALGSGTISVGTLTIGSSIERNIAVHEITVAAPNVTWIAIGATENSVAQLDWPEGYSRALHVQTLAGLAAADIDDPHVSASLGARVTELLDVVAEYWDLPEWVDPHITASADGDAVLEWWHDTRKLTVYVSMEAVEFVRVWGPDIHRQMDDGHLEEPSDLFRLLKWLLNRS